MHRWIRGAIGATVTVVAFSILTACTVNKVTEATQSENVELASKNVPTDSTCDAFYMVVSTIDGKISVLDLHQRGQLAWSIDADTRPLVSSSMADLELVRNGKKMRLIPALDGAIYQFDGEKVEPIPMSAESLLSSSYQLSDDAMIVGSKSVQNFGIDVKTGEVKFICNSDGCSGNQGEAEDSVNGSDVVVVTRITQVVRSVDIKHGQEKWNFSVGEHILSVPSPDIQSRIEDHFERPGDDLPHMFAGNKERKCPSAEELGDENFLRLVVPEGKVVALNKHDSGSVAWEHKFTSPIAKAWLLRKGKLHVMNLFTEQHIPTMNTFTPDDVESDSSTQPLLYIGSHKKILYIQPSPGMEAVLKMYQGRRIGHVFDANIKVAWRPYLNTASARTPIFGGNRQRSTSTKRLDKKNGKPKNSLAVWHEEYPFDTGYFLYPEFRDSRSTKKPMLIEDLRPHIFEGTVVNLWSYRKEILILIVVTVLASLAADLLVTKVWFQRGTLPLTVAPNSTNNAMENESDGSLASSESAPFLPRNLSNSSDEYVSRFAADFDCVQCLGKGGFGVVMEAVNKVDEQHYAVKRIKLPRSEGAKEKVLREVKALAKLEHMGIVRYFNAWVESPPAGWQEEKDMDLGLSDASRQTITNLTPSPHFASRFKTSNKLSPANPSLDTNTDSVVFALEDSETKHSQHGRITGSGSGEFTVHSNITDSHSSLGDRDVSFLGQYTRDFHKQTFTIEHEESHSCSRSSVPFSNYSATSSLDYPDKIDDLSKDSVVFEESESLSERLYDKRRDDFQHSEGGVVLSSDGMGVEETEPKYEKGAKDQGAKFFLYIQMQLYQKETLKEWLHNNTLNRSRNEVMDIFDQILCAVDYVHTCGLMHRDLKPSNIFFSSEGVVKVGDFGLVTPLSVQEDEEERSNCDKFTTNGHSTHTADVGTTLYMSPEQMARKPYNLKVDVFSLGLILLELWMPFSTQMERVRTLQDAKNHKLPPRFERELPIECELVQKMTSEDPCHRPDIKEIMNHSLFKDFAPSRFAQRQRTRTISNDSNNS